MATPGEQGHSCPPRGKQRRGQESPLSRKGLENTRSFLDPYSKIDRHLNRLPHWQQGEVWVFVTWRPGDSLPKGKLDQWKQEREIWIKHHPVPWDNKTEAEYHERFSRQIDEWLDQGGGSCVLKDPANSKIVANALGRFDGERYQIASFVVMPNHVHVLFRPLGEHPLPEIVKSWKGFTAREINKRIGKSGQLWQEDYWDRLIRNERHFFKVAEYIRENPEKARLREGEFLFIETEGGNSCPPTKRGTRMSPLRHPPGRLEAKVKCFCAIPQMLAFQKEYIVFAEKDEELHKYILRQHQNGAVDATVESRARQQHYPAQPALTRRLPGHHRDDDPQVRRHAGEPHNALEHLRPHRRSPPHRRAAISATS